MAQQRRWKKPIRYRRGTAAAKSRAAQDTIAFPHRSCSAGLAADQVRQLADDSLARTTVFLEEDCGYISRSTGTETHVLMSLGNSADKGS
jgi:hypothetical protein